MKHSMQWHDDLLVVAVEGLVKPEEARSLGLQMIEMLSDVRPRLVLLDYTRMTVALSLETRRATREVAEGLTWDRAAIYGITNINRMVLRVLVTLLGMANNTQFFATEAEARAWLQAHHA
ncbi:hypothetical protein PPSIR1_03333 [Plesiocystis pacifica SIR-1]|uniref:STAS/SEC14 domain-containing protein n=2 Tax=Plesiocystis pacifica TaxID=191768 RepID=A6G5C6_9BACT|nr:hypothetical protein PPSIR1_03333 [Plesiocystis pacifica SIR-1]